MKTIKKIASKLGVGYDKVLHFLVIFIVCLPLLFVNFWLSFGVFVVLSFGKELRDKRQPNNHFCWYDILADTVGFIGAIIVYLALLLLLVCSCSSPKVVLVEKEVRDSIYFTDTVVQVQLKPVYKVNTTKDTISYLESDYATSEAKTSNGVLFHNLETKEVDVPVKTKIVYKDREVRVPTPYEVEKIVKVEKKLTWWQKKKIQLGEVFIVVILVIGGGFIYKRFI